MAKKIYTQDELLKNTIEAGHSRLPEDADAFVIIPGEGDLIDFGYIPELKDSGLRAMPIRLCNGKHFGAGGGYGISHILYHHANALCVHNYYSVQDFVDDIAFSFDAIYLARDDRIFAVRRGGGETVVGLAILLEPLDDFYGVVSGWPTSKRHPIKGELTAERVNKEGVEVWECRAPHFE